MDFVEMLKKCLRNANLHWSVVLCWMFVSVFAVPVPVVASEGAADQSSAVADGFVVSVVPDSIFERMRNVSFPVREATAAGVLRRDLRYLQILHYDYEGQVRRGELICHHTIASVLLDIFRQLYVSHYPIASVRLIDDFGADDEQSMRANNTSCFCFRVVAGSKTLSKHSRGLAIDINPLENPYVKTSNGKTVVQPSTARPYVDRQKAFAHKIDRNDLAYRLFTAHGFTWGGAWRSLKDYQHFEYR